MLAIPRLQAGLIGQETKCNKTSSMLAIPRLQAGLIGQETKCNKASLMIAIQAKLSQRANHKLRKSQYVSFKFLVCQS
jgi:hypothetical protein